MIEFIRHVFVLLVLIATYFRFVGVKLVLDWMIGFIDTLHIQIVNKYN
jgi:hypothetical protein